MVKYMIALLCIGFLAGCGAKENDSTPERSEYVPMPMVAVESLPLPSGFPDIVPVMEGVLITAAEVTNADNNEFKVVGISTEDVDVILEYYINAFEIGEWTEDSVTAKDGNNQVSYIKGNLLVIMNAQKTETGSTITLTTGTSD